MYSVIVLCPHRQEHLPNCHPGAHSLGLSESTTHTGLEPASRKGNTSVYNFKEEIKEETSIEKFLQIISKT
jgi:hypothetical protein